MEGVIHFTSLVESCWVYACFYTCMHVYVCICFCVHRNGQQTVFIGSHSHKLFAIDMATGLEKWCSETGDRIEGTACLSACGQWVIVGKTKL